MKQFEYIYPLLNKTEKKTDDTVFKKNKLHFIRIISQLNKNK